jgi:hypothetical protein
MCIMSTVVMMSRFIILWPKLHKSSIKFGKGAKLSPRFMVSYEIVEKRGLLPFD